MSKKQFVKLLVFVIVSCMAVMVYAGNVHWSGGVSWGSGSITAQGKLAGLGNENVTVYMSATASVVAQCENKGGTQAAGRNSILATATASTSATPDSNGNAYIFLEVDVTNLTPTPVSPSPKEAGCPNGKWIVTGIVEDSAQWQSASIWIVDNITGAVIWKQDYTCSGSGSSLDCTPI